MNPLNSIVNIVEITISHITGILDLTEEELTEIILSLNYKPKQVQMEENIVSV